MPRSMQKNTGFRSLQSDSGSESKGGLTMQLYMYHCTNPACRHRYGFTLPEDPGMSPEYYNKQHRLITKAIASGRYGEKLRARMVSPASVLLIWNELYSFCPQCDKLDMVGNVKVLFHRQGKPVELDTAGNVRLKDTMSRDDFRHVLTLSYPCTKCGGQMEFYDDDRDIPCPHCGNPLAYGR